METKVKAASVGGAVAAGVSQVLLDAGLSWEDLVRYAAAGIATAVIAAVSGWLKANGNLASSTLDAADE